MAPKASPKFKVAIGLGLLLIIISLALAGRALINRQPIPRLDNAPTKIAVKPTLTPSPSSTPAPTSTTLPLPLPTIYLTLGHPAATSPLETPAPRVLINRGDTLTLPQPTPLPATATPAGRIPCTINTDVLHLREGPGSNYRIIDALQAGTPVIAVKCAPWGNWVLVETAQREIGWLNANFLNCQGELTTLPLAQGLVMQTPAQQQPPLSPTPVLTTTPSPPLSIDSWQGEYFDNPNLLGQPVFVRMDRDLEFDWILDSPGPGIPADNFSVRWMRLVDFFDGGDFRFFAEADDGLKIYVDDQLILDDWHTFAPVTYRADVRRLSPGLHTVTVEYFESGGHARIKVWGDKTRLEDTAWQAEYYPNRELLEPALFIRQDEVLDFDWGKGSPAPGLDGDYFSVRWRRTVFFDQGGDYKFLAKLADEDRVKIFLDDWLVVDKFKEESGTVEGIFTQLGPGFHIVTVEYQEEGDRARIKVWWDRQ